MTSRYGHTGRKDIAIDARRLKPFLNASGGDTYRVRVSADDTTPNYLEGKMASADTSVVITVTNDGADEDLDFSVAVYVAGEIATHTADDDAHHAPVTLGAGSDSILALSGQELTLGDVATQAELDAHEGVANAHHNQVHVLATNTGLGADHTVSGATAGHVLRASSATAAAFSQLQHDDLGGVGADDHHNQSHVLASTSGLGTDHTVSGLTAGQVLRATGATTARFQQLAHSDLSGIDANAHHDPVTLDPASDPLLTLVGQQLSLGDVATQVELDAVSASLVAHAADPDAHHALVTPGADISGLFSIGTGQIVNFRDQVANTVLAGPESGPDADPTMRLLVDADIPASIARGSEVTSAISAHASDANAHHNQSHVLATTSALGSDHTVSGLTARQVLIATGATTALFRALQTADLPTGATLSVSSTNGGNSHAITTSNNPSGEAILASNSGGGLGLASLSISGGDVVLDSGGIDIVSAGDLGVRFLMTNSDLPSGYTAFMDYNKTDRDGGSLGSLNIGNYRSSTASIEIRMSKENFEVISTFGATTYFPFRINVGQVYLESLPTADPGNAGQLWRSGGDLRVSI